MDRGATKAIERVQTRLRRAAREVGLIIERQKRQLAENERVIRWARQTLDEVRP